MVNQAAINDFKVFYWRDKNNEVDFVLVKRQKKIAIEVKTGRRIMNEDLSKFAEAYKPHRSIVVGSAAIRRRISFYRLGNAFQIMEYFQ